MKRVCGEQGYLRFTVDLSGFNSKADPPKTAAWREIVASNMAPEDAEWADVLESLGRPTIVTVGQIKSANRELSDWISKNPYRVAHRFEQNGYVRAANEGTKDGRWKIGEKNQVVYARRDLSLRDHIVAINVLNRILSGES